MSNGASPEVAQQDTDPINEAYRTISKLEHGIVAVDPNLALTSIAVSLVCITNELRVLNSNLMGSSNRTREEVSRVRDGLDKIYGGIDNYVDTLRRQSYER